MIPLKKASRLRRMVRPAHLELLAAMQHAPTLGAAARAAGVAQPAASRLLRELVDITGIELFEKFGRTLRPTPSGKIVLQHASRLVTELDRLEAELEAVDRGLMGTVSIGAGVAPCCVLVPRSINLLAQSGPKIFVSLREGGMDEFAERLREGQIDLLVGRIENAGRYSDLAFEELYDPSMRIVCGPQHPLAHRQTLSVAEAIRGTWLLPESNTSMRRGIETLFKTEKVWPDECLFESSSILANVALLSGNNVVWALSADIAAHFEQLGQLKILPVPELPGPGPVLMASLKSRSISPPVTRMQDCLRQAANELSRGG
ncbi:LysR substrate-binding domain-containing protein [Burkholderia diffusa]|uniref:LysR substrate-binding domain-containing protein n=1 Tax=Burkholderia diffusa TaxID=488732 RepID=UPI002AB12BBA|nr:LysR substrate-binding domain-containing protein [Burkholderia diffusa]